MSYLKQVKWATRDSEFRPLADLNVDPREAHFNPETRTEAIAFETVPIDAVYERVRNRPKDAVKMLEAQAFVADLVAASEGKLSKAKLRKKFGRNYENLMDKPEIRRKWQKVISDYGMNSPERVDLLKATTNQLVLNPKSVEDPRTVLAALKLMQEQEGMQETRQTSVSIELTAELADIAKEAGFLAEPEGEIVDIQPVVKEIEE